MKIEEHYIEKLCNTVAKTLVDAFEQLTINDVNMYQLGYNKAIDDLVSKINSIDYVPVCTDCLTKRQISEIAEQLREARTDV